MAQTSAKVTAAACYQSIANRGLVAQPWLVTESGTVTFGQLRARIDAVTALLQGQGIAVGDRVVIATRDDAEAAQLFVALICNGVTAVNLDPDAGPDRAQSLIAKATPRLIIIDRDLLARWPGVRAAGPVVEIVPAARSTGVFGKLMTQKPKREGLHALLEQQTPQAPPAGIDPETLAYILFTSGTTDQPKGVSISHRALFAHLATLSRRYNYTPTSRILNTLMLSHADGMIQGPVIAFFNAIPVYRPLRFEVTTINLLLDSIYQLRITHLIAVPTMLSLILRLGLDQRDAFQGGDFKLLVSCGAQLEPKLWEDFERTFQVSLVNVYGLTETVVGGVFSGPDAMSRQPGSIGVPEDCELRLADRDGKTVADGEHGELLMRGELLMSGYFDAPQMTAEVLNDGWFRTGDIARRDEAGRFWITGRAKNIIIRGGYNIHPEEITEVLQRHPAVTEAVTLGVKDLDWGETVIAVVAADAAVSDTELLTHCAANLEPRKVPGRIQRVAALPRGRSGKVVLEQVRALLAQAPMTRGDANGPSADDSERLLKLAASCFKTSVDTITLASRPRDVPGWDSLAHLELVCALEKEFDLRLSSRDIMSLDRLDKALGLIQKT